MFSHGRSIWYARIRRLRGRPANTSHQWTFPLEESGCTNQFVGNIWLSETQKDALLTGSRAFVCLCHPLQRIGSFSELRTIYDIMFLDIHKNETAAKRCKINWTQSCVGRIDCHWIVILQSNWYVQFVENRVRHDIEIFPLKSENKDDCSIEHWAQNHGLLSNLIWCLYGLPHF